MQTGKTLSGSFFAERLDRHGLQKSPRAGQLKKKIAQLTTREVEVLPLVAEGKTTQETASELGISIKIVEKHREHLSAKLDLHDIAGLTRYAIAAGVVESSVQVTIVWRVGRSGY